MHIDWDTIRNIKLLKQLLSKARPDWLAVYFREVIEWVLLATGSVEESKPRNDATHSHNTVIVHPQYNPTRLYCLGSMFGRAVLIICLMYRVVSCSTGWRRDGLQPYTTQGIGVMPYCLILHRVEMQLHNVYGGHFAVLVTNKNVWLGTLHKADPEIIPPSLHCIWSDDIHFPILFLVIKPEICSFIPKTSH